MAPAPNSFIEQTSGTLRRAIPMQKANVFAVLVAATVLAAAQAASAGERVQDFCIADLSTPTNAYACSRQRLDRAQSNMNERRKELLSALAISSPRRTDDSLRKSLAKDQAAWRIYLRAHCAIEIDFAGREGDWHYVAASEHTCLSRETEERARLLEKWRQCAGSDPAGACLP